MSSVQEPVAISTEQEEASQAFHRDLMETVKHGLQVWLNQPVKVTASTVGVQSPDDARLKLPSSGFGYVATLHSKSPHVLFVADRRLVRSTLAAAAGTDPAEADDVDTTLTDETRPAIAGLGSLCAGGIFDRGLGRPEDGRTDADCEPVPLVDSSWVESEDPLLGSDRFAYFEGKVTIGDGPTGDLQLFLPWGYVSALFQYVGNGSEADEAQADSAAGAAMAGAGASGQQFSEEPMSIAALVKREPPPPPPTGEPPRVKLMELHRFRSKRQFPIRYTRGHQMRQTRELSPIYLVGSGVLMPVLTAAHQDREIFHLPDARELSQRMEEGQLPAAVIVHIHQGHEPWMVGWVGETKFRENLDRQPVVVVLDDSKSSTVELCGRLGLVNVLPSEVDPDQILELIAPHLD